MNEGFDDILAASNPHVQDLTTRTRALIKDVMPDVVEVPWPRQKVVGYGAGPKKMSGHFCYIAVHKNHVNLGFGPPHARSERGRCCIIWYGCEDLSEAAG